MGCLDLGVVLGKGSTPSLKFLIKCGVVISISNMRLAEEKVDKSFSVVPDMANENCLISCGYYYYAVILASSCRPHQGAGSASLLITSAA